MKDRYYSGRLFFIALFCLFLFLPLACAHKSVTPVENDLESILASTRNRYDVPAMAGVVISGDSILDTKAIGIRRLDYSTPVTINDRFHIGSMTKAMTATVIAMLVEEGKLSWDSKPLDIFPELSDSITPAYRDITLTQLLSHRAGIPPFTEGTELAKLPTFTGTATAQRRAFTSWLLSHQPIATPGTQYVYSNAGYSIATAMAEQVSGLSWETLIDTRLFEPLGIDGHFGWPAHDDPNQPWGHWEENGSLVPHDPNGEYQQPDIIASAGSVNLSIGDYARFVQMHLRGLEGHDSLITAQTFTFLHTPIGDYAMGWGVEQIDGVTSSLHDGSAGTFYAIVDIQPSRNLAVTVFANAGNAASAAACAEAIDKLLKRQW